MEWNEEGDSSVYISMLVMPASESRTSKTCWFAKTIRDTRIEIETYHDGFRYRTFKDSKKK